MRYLFVLAGQSNMAGRGAMTTVTPTADGIISGSITNASDRRYYFINNDIKCYVVVVHHFVCMYVLYTNSL